MEELELEPEEARALLRSPCPLSDVYRFIAWHIVLCRVIFKGVTKVTKKK